jgi:hypothetical protein
MARAMEILQGVNHDHIMATGYGRHLFELSLNAATVTEIKAYAVGARFLFPEVRAILDIGGQDSKAIALNDEGKVVKFEMNDKCAAGTGKFLEFMAQTLGYGLDKFGQEALKAKKCGKGGDLTVKFQIKTSGKVGKVASVGGSLKGSATEKCVKTVVKHFDFDPFSGGAAPAHGWPWNPEPEDPPGTDRIMVVSSYGNILPTPTGGTDEYTHEAHSLRVVDRLSSMSGHDYVGLNLSYEGVFYYAAQHLY